MVNQNPFNDFLSFETHVFGLNSFIARYDPYLIRYGEYLFSVNALQSIKGASETIPLIQPGETILDLGCEQNIFSLYLAYLGAQIIGIDLNPQVWPALEAQQKKVEQATGKKLTLTFQAGDATNLSFAEESVDKVISISSVEHMFSSDGHGDAMAIESIARVLKPGGHAILTVPMSNGGPFHESPTGDANFGYSYRLYTPEALKERLLYHPKLETMRVQFLAQTTPDQRYQNTHFIHFWVSLTPEERLKWDWANPIFASVFNPIIEEEEAKERPETVNTALVWLKKK
ncbi:MAG: methyltransferase domain-containing protein [Chloroflexota bacterium]